MGAITHSTAALPDFVAVMMAMVFGPEINPVKFRVGVVSEVIPSDESTPVSDATSNEMPVGFVGATVSIVIERGAEISELVPVEGDDCWAVTLHVPSTIDENVQLIVKDVAICGPHVSVTPALTAVTVKGSPTTRPEMSKVGVVSLVTLSVFEAPVSDPA